MGIDNLVNKFVKSANSFEGDLEISDGADYISELHDIKGKLGMYISKNKSKWREEPHVRKFLDKAYFELEGALDFIDDGGMGSGL
jgi:hypothetical protein